MNPIMGTFVAMAIILGFSVFLSARWVMFAKAGQPGWASLIPVYHWHVEFKITGRSHWWDIALWLFWPTIFLLWILHNLDLAKSFGRSVWFGIGLMVLPFLFYPAIAFGSSRYVGPDGLGACATRGDNPFLRNGELPNRSE